MSAAWTRHAMCESALKGSTHQDRPVSCKFNKITYGFSQNLASDAFTKK